MSKVYCVVSAFARPKDANPAKPLDIQVPIIYIYIYNTVKVRKYHKAKVECWGITQQ